MLAKLLTQTNMYLLGRITLQELEEWLVANLQVILDSGDDRSTHLANELDAELIQYGEGIIDELTIREHIERQTLSTPPIMYVDSVAVASLDFRVIAGAVASSEHPFRFTEGVVANR